jgi:hypothetical protein
VLSKRWIVNALLVALIIGLAFAGAFFEPGDTVEKKPTISQLTADEVDTIEIETGDLQLRLQRGSNGWNIESPINWPAQENNVRRLLSILKIEADALSDIADVDLVTLGLQQPKARMRFNGIPLLFGATNNIGERRYAMLEDKLYLLPDVHLVFVNQGLAGLVDRRLLPGRQGIVSLRLPDLELRLDENNLWRSNQAIEFSQASLLRLVDNWRDLQATRISNLDLELPPRQLIEIELADGEVIEFLLMSEDPEIIIAHPNLGLQYHFRRDYRDQLITLSADASES